MRSELREYLGKPENQIQVTEKSDKGAVLDGPIAYRNARLNLAHYLIGGGEISYENNTELEYMSNIAKELLEVADSGLDSCEMLKKIAGRKES